MVWKGNGREELRASILKPYFLRLRADKGEKAARALIATTGLPAAALDNETTWISVAAARRALAALSTAFGGEQALRRRGEWAVHPEALGTYVRLLRGASSPQDGYRQLCEHAEETSRVGTLECEILGPTRVRVTYSPIEGDEPPEHDPLLSLAREAELASMPQLWGLDEATVEHPQSTGRDDRTSVYELSWKTPSSPLPPAGAAVAGALVLGLLGIGVGSWVTALVLAPLGGGLGWLFGQMHARMLREQVSRSFERHRIAALERGLQLRGDLPDEQPPPGELDGAVLGGKYRILKKIGSGGIGVVYSAQHLTLGGTVAVKVLRGAAARDASEIARLRREAQVQSNIEHPNVVRTLDLDQMPDGSLYVVMELLRGVTLADKLAREGPLAPGLAVPVFCDVCKALAAAHAKGVVHRDLKPGNIFLCETGEAKVLDFGMSKLHSAETLTQEGYTLGTPEYMSPEQCIGAPVEPRTDLYALGVMMYEALSGELPIQAKNRRDLLDLHQQQIPQSLRQRRPDLPIPPALDEAVMLCLRKRLSERPRDARELEHLLGAVPLEGLPTSYPRAMARRRV